MYRLELRHGMRAAVFNVELTRCSYDLNRRVQRLDQHFIAH